MAWNGLIPFYQLIIGPLSPLIFFGTPFVSPATISHHMGRQFITKYSSIRGKHVIGLKLVTSFPLFLSFIISTALRVVNQFGVSFISKHNCNCVAVLLWQYVHVFIQYPRSPSQNVERFSSSLFVIVSSIYQWL